VNLLCVKTFTIKPSHHAICGFTLMPPLEGVLRKEVEHNTIIIPHPVNPDFKVSDIGLWILGA